MAGSTPRMSPEDFARDGLEPAIGELRFKRAGRGGASAALTPPEPFTSVSTPFTG